MATLSATTDDKRCDAFLALKRHLARCRECQGALKAMDAREMCPVGTVFTLQAAKRYDSLVSRRIAAHNNPAGTVFACPDLSKHGKTYALLAEPLAVTGIQGNLF